MTDDKKNSYIQSAIDTRVPIVSTARDVENLTGVGKAITRAGSHSRNISDVQPSDRSFSISG